MLLRVVEFCGRRGHDVDDVCRTAGVDRALLVEPEGRVPYGVVARLGERALQITCDPDFGLHLAEDVRETRDFDAGLLLLMASPTVGAALERFAAKQRYWGDGNRATLRRVHAGLAIRYALPGAQGLYARHADECAMAEIALGVRVLSGHPLRPRVVRFRHPSPKNTSEHQRVFDCQLEFATPHTEIVFDDAALETKMQHANAAFLAIFERQVEGALARLPSATCASGAVREAARAALAGGSCTLAATARVVGLSPRTLQRRLKDENTSFGEIVDVLRREMAVAYLERQIPIADVAALLGYADATAFHHAFRRWTGASPSSYTKHGPGD